MGRMRDWSVHEVALKTKEVRHEIKFQISDDRTKAEKEEEANKIFYAWHEKAVRAGMPDHEGYTDKWVGDRIICRTWMPD